jgi:dTDP-4-amino-4,6-dideoxygalactose transaminase
MLSARVIPVMLPCLGEAEAEAAAAAVRSGWVAQGPRVAAFERAFADRVGAAHGVAVSSCTTALHLALHLLGVGPGDEVIVPSFSFIATANAVRYTGAMPVFADVEAENGNLSALTVEPVVTPRTRAVVAVHQAGVPADVDSIRDALPAGVTVVEDAACAAGATYRGRPVGAGSALAAWSFHPRKLLTTGEGGMVTTDDEEWARRLRRLREHGMNVSAADRHSSGRAVLESYLEVGFNYRMTDIQAAVGMVQLGRLDGIVAERRRLAGRYRELLADVPGIRAVTDPAWGEGNFQSFWVELPADFPVSRDDVLAAMTAQGISPRRGIMAAHLEPAYTGHPHVPLPITERLTRQTLVLPLHHEVSDTDQELIVSVLRELAARPSSSSVLVGDRA